MKIISRSEAARQGQKRYYTGDFCKHGHDAPRYVCNTKCIACDIKEDVNVKIINKQIKRWALVNVAIRNRGNS